MSRSPMSPKQHYIVTPGELIKLNILFTSYDWKVHSLGTSEYAANYSAIASRCSAKLGSFQLERFHLIMNYEKRHTAPLRNKEVETDNCYI